MGDCSQPPLRWKFINDCGPQVRLRSHCEVSCPYRIGTVNTIRDAAIAAVSMHRGAIPQHYGCMSVCEVTIRKSVLATLQRLLMQLQLKVWLNRAGCARVSVLGQTNKVTWLILPVVICLSQRLSHACLSISLYTVRLRMAH